MSNKQTLLLLLFMIFFGQDVFGGGIKEADIPMPETQYDLPENLVGDFILTSKADREIRIFPNNKFISWQYSNDQFG